MDKKLSYSEARKILAGRIIPHLKALGEEILQEDLRYVNFNINLCSPGWSYRQDYSKVIISIKTTEYPTVCRKLNGFQIESDDVAPLMAKIKDIIEINKKKSVEAKEENFKRQTAFKALFEKLKPFNPRIDYGIILFDVPYLKIRVTSDEHIDVEFQGKIDDLISVLPKWKESFK